MDVHNELAIDELASCELVEAAMPGRRWSHHVTDPTQHDYDATKSNQSNVRFFCQTILRGVVVSLRIVKL